MNSADLVARLREQGTLAVCPYDRRSPDYWTAPNDKPCPMCGGEPEGPDKCTGADLRVMADAADRIEALEAWKAEAMEVLRRHRGNTVPVMKALMATGSRDDLVLADDVHRADDAARRLVEKEDGHG